MSKTSVTLSAIETYVKNTTKREGPDALEQAWQVAQSEGAQSDFSGFILLAARLQESRPGEPILLPLERTAKMMDVHVTQVTRWRKRAYAMGFLELHKHSVRKRRAAEYFSTGLLTKQRRLCHQVRCVSRKVCHHLST